MTHDENVYTIVVSQANPLPLLHIERAGEIIPVHYSDLPFPIQAGDVAHMVEVNGSTTIGVNHDR